MKRFMTLAVSVMAVMLIALTSCEKKSEFKLSGDNLPAELNGQYLEILDAENNTVDTLLVSNGSFSTTWKPAPAEAKQHFLIIPNHAVIPFFIEDGEFELVAVPQDDGTNDYELTGDPETYTIKYQSMQKEITALADPFYQQIQALSEELRGSETQPTEEQVTRMQDLQKEYFSTINGKLKEYYAANKDNVLAPLIFPQIRFEDDAEFVAEYEAAADAIKNNERIKAQYETILKAMETSVGKMYTDFTMDNGEGETKNLSDFMNGEDYLLIDFFASWCGPCKRSMPKLAELNKNYSSKGLRLLSIGTWEGNRAETPEKALENHKTAVKEWGVTWEHYYDSQSVGPETYGVPGIPMLLLISPEGEILVRSHGVEEVEAKLQELLQLK